jgi:hypothetical protein
MAQRRIMRLSTGRTLKDRRAVQFQKAWRHRSSSALQIYQVRMGNRRQLFMKSGGVSNRRMQAVKALYQVIFYVHTRCRF